MNIANYLRKKTQETGEKIDWNLGYIKDKIDTIAKIIKDKFGTDNNIKWKG